MRKKAISPLVAVLTSLLVVVSFNFLILGFRAREIETNYSNFLEDVSEQVANMTEQISTLEEKIKTLESKLEETKESEGDILFRSIQKFEGNRTLVVSLKENETIAFSINAKEGSLNFTFGLLKEEKFDDISYVTNLIPEYQVVFNEEDLITQISFQYTTYLEGLYGFSMESSSLVISDVLLSKK